MFSTPVRTKIAELSVLSAVFLTPLLFFLGTRDQFELPKLTLLSLLAALLLVLTAGTGPAHRRGPVLGALLALTLVQAVCSLPSTSLSWRVSWLGDYENFFGMTTSLVFLAWFLCFSRVLTKETMEKALFLNTLAALLSAFYAVGQRFGFDFIQWNPDSINPSREFASLGNPNFLGAYLAMSFPLHLYLFRKGPGAGSRAPRPGPSILLLGAAGFLLLLLGTGQGITLLGLPLSGFPIAPCRLAGFTLFSVFAARILATRHPMVGFAGCALLLLGLLSTGSRGGFLGLLTGAGLWTLLSWRSGTISLSLSGIPKRTFVAGILLLAAGLWAYGRSFLDRFLGSLAHVGESLEVSRLHIWRPALRMIEANPILGTGLDTFKTAFPTYSGVEFARIDGNFVSSRTAHNELLQAAATTGLLGLTAYLLLLGAFLFVSMRAWKEPGSRGLLTALLASAAAFHAQNLFSFGVAAIHFLWIFILACVTLLDRTAGRPFPFPRHPGILLTVLLAFFLTLFPLRRMAADAAFGKASSISGALRRPQLPGTTDKKRLSDLGIAQNLRAAELMPLEVKYRLYLGQAYEQRTQWSQDEAEVWTQKAAECYEQASAMNPANAYYRNNEGRIYSNLSRWDPSYRDRAEKAYEKAVQLAGNGPLFLVQWGLALEGNGKQGPARSVFERAFGADADLTAKVLTQSAVVEYDAGQKAKAYSHLAQAIAGFPTGPEAYYVRGRLRLYDGRKKEARSDFLKAQALGPTGERNPSVQDLDRYLAETQK